MSAQVGLGNHDPRGLVDLNDNQNGNATSGFVIPVTSTVTTLINPVDNKTSEVPGP